MIFFYLCNHILYILYLQIKNYITPEFFGSLLYLCCMIYQIFIYCWHGNELYLHVCNCKNFNYNNFIKKYIFQSMKICLSAYKNNWWNNNKNFNYALLIIMIRTQIPLIIIVGKIMELSLQNFLLVCIYIYFFFIIP